MSELRLLPVPFTRLPTQSVKITLSGIVPPTGPDMETKLARLEERLLDLCGSASNYEGAHGLHIYLTNVVANDDSVGVRFYLVNPLFLFFRMNNCIRAN